MIVSQVYCSNPECKEAMQWPVGGERLSIHLEVQNLNVACKTCHKKEENGILKLGYCRVSCLQQHVSSEHFNQLCTDLRAKRSLFEDRFIDDPIT